MGFGQLGKVMLVAGGLLAGVGLLMVLASRWKAFPFGRLPGDISVQREGFSLFVPITSMILLSLLVTGIFLLVQLLRR